MIVVNREVDRLNRQRFALYGEEPLFVAVEYDVMTGLGV